MFALLYSLEPDLNFVAIRIGDVSVGQARGELATTEQAASGAFDLGDGTVDVVGVHEPKAEMRDAATETGRGGVLGEGEDVVPTRRLSVDEPISAPVLTQTEDLLVEPQRASQVPHREIDMRKAVGLNHGYLEILSRSNDPVQQQGPLGGPDTPEKPYRGPCLLQRLVRPDGRSCPAALHPLFIS